MAMDMTMELEWLRRKAAEEANGVVSAGGLAARVGALSAAGIRAADKAALAKLVELRRRALGLRVADLAARAGVGTTDVAGIEGGDWDSLEPRTVHHVAAALALPGPRLLQLAGLAAADDARVHEAAARFAARSEPVEALTPREHEALEEFVQALAAG